MCCHLQGVLRHCRQDPPSRLTSITHSHIIQKEKLTREDALGKALANPPGSMGTGFRLRIFFQRRKTLGYFRFTEPGAVRLVLKTGHAEARAREGQSQGQEHLSRSHCVTPNPARCVYVVLLLKQEQGISQGSEKTPRTEEPTKQTLENSIQDSSDPSQGKARAREGPSPFPTGVSTQEANPLHRV